jgi:hypothetical protein
MLQSGVLMNLAVLGLHTCCLSWCGEEVLCDGGIILYMLFCDEGEWKFGDDERLS